MPAMNAPIQLLARSIPLNGLATTTRATQRMRTYATKPSQLPGGANTKPLMIAALIGVPTLAYFMIPSRKGTVSTQVATMSHDQPSEAQARPNLDPAAATRRRRGEAGVGDKYVHPEHEKPEEFKPAFGQLHAQKRVDGPPDGRHHQSLNDRARV